MKRLLLILSLVCLAISTCAGQINRDQALRKAQQFLSQNGKSGSLEVAETAMSRARRRSLQVPDYYYVFNVGQEQGYVIVSGDDRTPEILGYSLSGSFDIDNLPPAMEALLNHYSEEIRQIQEGRAVAVKRSAPHPSVPQMMTVKWGQDDPYNLKTMTGYYTNGKTFQCVTGCVATAMAQVLYHQHFVDQIQAEIPGYQNPIIYKDGTGYMNAIPAGTVLDWGHMVDSYNGKETEAQKDAVASLMMYCGVAVRMEYTKEESSASIADIPEAIKAYFGYSRGARHVRRSSYAADDWDNLIYDEIASGRPVIYGGTDQNGGGHAFILHGYDGDGRYAVNWGWGGYQDNYFMLDDLTPPSHGTGGGSGGYNFDQDAVIYLTKEDGTFQEDVIATVSNIVIGEMVIDSQGYLVMPTGQSYQASRNKAGGVSFALALTYTSDLANTYHFDLGYGVQNPEGKLIGDVVSLRENLDLKQGLWRTTATGNTSFSPGCPEGTYYIKAYSRESGTTEWRLCKKADQFAVKMEISSTAINFEVVDISTPNPDPDPDPQPEVSQAERDELAGLYAAQKKAIDEKIEALSSINASLKTILQVFYQKKDSLQTLVDKMTAIEEKLKSEHLTAEQKQSYLNELNTLKSQISTLITSYNAAVDDFNAIQDRCSKLSTTLNTLLSTVNTEAAAVSSITTKAALDASKARVAEITSQQSECYVATETAKTTALETAVAGINVADAESGLTSLETSIDAAIAAAIQGEQDDKDKKKLEEGKKSLQDSYDNLKTDLAAKQLTVNDNEKRIASLEADIQKAQDAIVPIEKKIAEIKESLNNDMLSAEQKEKFQSRLMALDKAKTTYADDLKTLETKLAPVKKAHEELKAKLEAIANLISTQVEAIKNITTTDELSKAQADRQDVEAQLGNVNPADVEKELISLESELVTLTLTLDYVTKDLASLEADIQQGAQLTKAQEDCQTAINNLDEVINAHKGYWAVLKEAQDELKAKMTENSDVVAVLKKQYSEIEQKLQDLIDKQPSTRADDDPIAALQERLKQLADNIAILESQYQQVSAMIEQLEDYLEPYALLIEKVTKARDQLLVVLASATTADDVGLVTVEVGNVANELSTDGVDFYNQFVDSYVTVLDNLNAYIRNINIVYTQANNLEEDVEYETTDIQRVAVDESEVWGRYDMKGNRVDSTYKGMQIIRLKNGKTIKLNVK
ncbi:MAG: C10 family peptidase [Prevotella sp.]|nr:C10 family peptidase [Prevotella sp.]